MKPSFQLRPRQRPILSQNKAISGKGAGSQPHNRFVFCVVVVEFAVNGNQA